ncbi:MAG TPA: aspartate aminotransferase family protein [Gaiellaceae bacterium]|nr:aspartate aminotransferase family protein [Gaiellaceae bacterium]
MTRAFWNPMTNMGAFRERGITIVRGEGSTVWDDAGKALLDASAALWYCNVGYGRAELADAAAAQMRELGSFKTYDGFTSPKTEELADRIAGIVPLDGAKVYFTSGGGESIDTAAKLARAYWAATGKPDKHVVLSRQFAYHGSNAYGTSLGGLSALTDVYGRLVSDVDQVPWDDAEALAAAIDRIGADRVAAFFAEPVIGAGGVLFPPEGYLDRVREICTEREVLLVLDEVITGFGRTGEWFASGRYGVAPDLITVAKGITSGYIQLGGVIASARVAEPFWTEGTQNVFRHGFTYAGHATACAVGLANLDVIEREGLVQRVRDLEPVLAGALRPLADHPAVADVRAGVGLLGAVELADPSKLQAVVDAAHERGVLVRGIRGVALQVSPPFVITEDEIAETARVFADALDAAA